MDNQHKLIKGYRDLSKQEIDLMNRIKTHAEVLGLLVEEVQQQVNTENSTRDNSQRFLDSAKMDLQTGVMKLIRVVAKPSTF